MNGSALENELLRLGPFDPEKDAEIESGWTLNSDYMSSINPHLPRPLSPEQIKKRYENLEKRAEDEKLFFFALRARSDDRLLGYAQFGWISWAHGDANLTVAIGDPKAQADGWLHPALEVMAAYAFTELNLHRLTLQVPGYDHETKQALSACGFSLEVRQRQALQRDGQRWDLLRYGMLSREWQAHQGERRQP